MTTTDSFDLAFEIAQLLERKNRHLSDSPSEGMAAATGVEEVALEPRRLRRAKKSYNARGLHALLRQTDNQGFSLRRGRGVTPQAGDFVLARVTTIGQHKRLESQTSRRRHLFEGDEIIVAYGNRYAPDQFLAEVPRNLNYTNLVAAGGMAGRVIEKHANIQPATVIEPLGLICDSEGVLSMSRLADHQIRPWQQAQNEYAQLKNRPHITVVFGSSMNSGKSTTLGCLVNGISAAGLTVNAGKATGTGAGNDAGLFRDAGANRVVDFTDFGLSSTFTLSMEDVKNVLFSMVASLCEDSPDVVLIEIADGIYQGETAALMRDPDFGELVDSVVFACGEALSAAAGVGLIRDAKLPLKAVSGRLTSSPLITQEAVEVVDVPIIPTFDLCKPHIARETIGL
ncbi:hypothetical protein SAMN05421878_10551 [Actinobaculum suis]|uniref:DUF1611 domain-containing protein n=1 Tax=Actinobaculum suis TaxID=1657 RepID=A0A1G7BN14_9ACTO|nr:DUF1611 domain-containing protein [Actinobaculum suis]MDY5153762.1 hypothetical protein [Actinobaculum suis]SDE27816.1 hypothetical protein SAMN05421878_10551 [Actinobaculum suis]VDG76615.1 Uncharacterised protein [Actinobaculum suis]